MLGQRRPYDELSLPDLRRCDSAHHISRAGQGGEAHRASGEGGRAGSFLPRVLTHGGRKGEPPQPGITEEALERAARHLAIRAQTAHWFILSGGSYACVPSGVDEAYELLGAVERVESLCPLEEARALLQIAQSRILLGRPFAPALVGGRVSPVARAVTVAGRNVDDVLLLLSIHE